MKRLYHATRGLYHRAVRVKANLGACFFFSSVTETDQIFAVGVLHAVLGASMSLIPKHTRTTSSRRLKIYDKVMPTSSTTTVR